MLFPLLCSFALSSAQQVGSLEKEVHPKLQWKSCTSNTECQTVDGEVVMDANWRWLHQVDGYRSCYSFNEWNWKVCNSNANCTATCALEGVDYKKVYGAVAANDSLSLRLKTPVDFSYNVGSRLFLLESKNKYQTFTLLNNEIAFDVDLSTVECGINAALSFVAMDADGGMARWSTNKAGAEYGTGYCDARCSQGLKFVGGEANMEGWIPSETDPFSGKGNLGACCPEMAIWNSNAHSFSMSSHTCQSSNYRVCETYDCNLISGDGDPRSRPLCNLWGCNYNPYRMGVTDFYGKGKTVDTAKKFTVITQFNETRVTQFFVQDGKRIDVPPPQWDGLPRHSGLSEDMCLKIPDLFEERYRFELNGGWSTHIKMLSQPMVLAMSINDDHLYHNIWLDSLFPIDDYAEGLKGRVRGDCRWEDNDPLLVEAQYPNAKVVWSNIRFGPIGSTVNV